MTGFPELEPYVAVAFTSKNFAARRQKGESDSELSLRIARGWVGGCVATVKQAYAGVKVYMYDVSRQATPPFDQRSAGMP